MKPIWKKLLLRVFGEYGSLIVLLLLCVTYSLLTIQTFQPVTPEGARALAAEVATLGDSQRVVVLVEETAAEDAFAKAFAEAADEESSLTVVATIQESSPRIMVLALNEIPQSAAPINIVVTHGKIAERGFLKEDRLQRLIDETPLSEDVRIMSPKAYRWSAFLTRGNLTDLLSNNAIIAILAIGMTLVIITGGIDLSVGSVLAVSGVTTAICIETMTPAGSSGNILTLAFCAFIGVAVCGAIGTATGLLVTYVRIPAFIVTLAGIEAFRGVALKMAVAYQASISGGPTQGTPEGIKIHAESFYWLHSGTVFSIPMPIVLMLLLYLTAHLVMTRTSFGRYVYAVGGNAEAARLSGVPVVLVLIIVYAICGACAGLGGVIDAAKFESGRPVGGVMYELQVIAAVVVGGTSLAGGKGSIPGTLIGVMIIGVINNGLNIMNVGSYDQSIVFGSLIVAAATLDTIRRWLERRMRSGT